MGTARTPWPWGPPWHKQYAQTRPNPFSKRIANQRTDGILSQFLSHLDVAQKVQSCQLVLCAHRCVHTLSAYPQPSASHKKGSSLVDHMFHDTMQGQIKSHNMTSDYNIMPDHISHSIHHLISFHIITHHSRSIFHTIPRHTIRCQTCHMISHHDIISYDIVSRHIRSDHIISWHSEA